MVRSIALVAGAVALLCGSTAAAQDGGGGTSPPGPGDTCPAAYPGDKAARKPLARWMARAAALRDVPEQLPVMAALAESGLRNLHRKGNPFAGFFSMHRSLDKPPYKGFKKNPDLQLRWFLDTAVVVRQRALANGHEVYGTEPTSYGIWIADVERPARQNRSGYQPYLDDAEDLLPKPCRPSSFDPDEQAPPLYVSTAARQRDVVTIKARCPREACLVGARAEPKRRVRAAAAVESDGAAVVLTLPARTRRSTRLTVTVTAVDQAGNATRKAKHVTLLR